MGVTRSESGEHSTATGDPAAGGPAPYDPRPRLRRRFFASLVLIGLLTGLLIGRLVDPGPVRLEAVQALPEGLQLRFDREPALHQEYLDGAFGMLVQAEGRDQQGELRIDDMPVRWRIQPSERGLLVNLVAVRALRVQWQGEERDGGWWMVLEVSPATP
ncbi:hypothetical protein [Stutzerimonas nitrititolerans]|uniref:hypothetical protein n=1 Tax=Stutzerimonas nitrititolerans TaxID=2482751 RepID=UPI0028994F09|nr:hypothetical protein [Stutzerimonas nitrititolerans]